MQISFPSASLLIKQLNGQKTKVVLRVKSVHEHIELDPELQCLSG